MPDRVRRIAVVVSGVNEEYQQQVIGGAERFAAEHAVHLCLFAAMGGVLSGADYDAGEYNIFRLLQPTRFDGILLLVNTIPSAAERKRLLDAVNDAGVPVVLVDTAASGAVSVVIDNYAAMRGITEHLTDHHGCRRIAYIGGPRENAENAERLRAVQDVLAERGLTLEPERIWDGHFLSADGSAAVRRFLSETASEPGLPDAIICANDVMAIAAVNALQSYGISVPQDMIVTGFDHTFAGRNFSPELTCVDCGLSAAGSLACRMLWANEVQPGVTRTVLRDTAAVLSESCGCCEHTADSEQTFRRYSIRTALQYTESARLNSRMSCAFGECETLPQLIAALRNYVPEMPCEGFRLCLNTDWAGDKEAMLNAAATGEKLSFRTEGFPEQMCVPLAYENGAFTDAADFPSAQMLPSCVPETGNGTDYFFPLHFRSRSFGYCVMRGSVEMVHSPAVFSWMITLGNALEHIRRLSCTNAMVSRLEELHVTDALTGLMNRRGFARETSAAYEEALKQHCPVMIMFADLDGLKQINDVYGHDAGDNALRAVGHAVRDVCQNGEIGTRFGGDEYLIFASGKTEAECAALSEALQEHLKRFNEREKNPYTVSVSIGWHLAVPEPGSTVFRIIAEADQKMYEEKKKRAKSKYLRK